VRGHVHVRIIAGLRWDLRGWLIRRHNLTGDVTVSGKGEGWRGKVWKRVVFMKKLSGQ
jgi:hypothetical protein